VLTWLTSYLTPAQESRYFLCRLLPPRPTFHLDMTEDERAVMLSHAGYWRDLMAKGNAIVFGPVADPKVAGVSASYGCRTRRA